MLFLGRPISLDQYTSTAILHILALSHYSDAYDVWIEEVP